MDENKFWEMIEMAKSQSNGNGEEQCELLKEYLKEMEVNEILEFHQIMLEKRGFAYHANLWEAADFINSGCSDDGFEYFRGWLIAQGRDIFYSAVSNPDILAQVVTEEEDCENEAMIGVALEAYCEKTGKEFEEFPSNQFYYKPVLQNKFSENDEAFERRLPNLIKKLSSE